MKKYAILTILTLIFVLVILGTASATDPTTERVSTTDTQGDDSSSSAVITPDGRYTAFASDATNLVSGDTNGATDVFVKDGWTGSITRVSTSASGTQGNDDSEYPVITPDGRYIVFDSYATNLVSGDTNGYKDVFVKDGWTGAITRVSTTASGAQATGGSSYSPVITPDGRYIAFDSDATNLVTGDSNGMSDVFVKDVRTGSIIRVSTTASGAQATGGDSNYAAITPDGRYIAFQSEATNLVTGDTNTKKDIFVKDGWTGAITRVSTTSAGAQADNASWDPVITPDGRYIAFDSYATNLVSGDTNGKWDVFIKDGWTGSITRVSTSASGTQGNGDSEYPVITPDGRYIVFRSQASNLVSGDTNGATDVFVKDGWTGSITRVSTTASGAQATGGGSYSPVITPDGRYIAFDSGATNLVSWDTNGVDDVFVKDGWTGSITLISATKTGEQANSHSDTASLTPDGRYVVFRSDADNLVLDDTNSASDIFVHDNVTKRTIRVSTSTTGAQANDGSWNPKITPDGRYVVFDSDATNLVSADTNGMTDVFVKDMWTGATTRVSTTSTGAQATGGIYGSYTPSITPDGRYIVFTSSATNLAGSDTNSATDIFVKDGWYGTVIRVSTTSSGGQANYDSWWASITPNGRYIIFDSEATNLVSGDTNNKDDVFVKDGWTGAITRVSTSATGAQSNDGSYVASITPDGRYIIFESDATNLVSGDTNDACDVFVKDGWTGAITRISTTSTGAQADSGSYSASITQNGRYIAFHSAATNLVSGDTNDCSDVFVKDGWTGAVTRVSVDVDGAQADDTSYDPVITPDGRYIAFNSYANLLGTFLIWPLDSNDACDVYVRKFW